MPLEALRRLPWPVARFVVRARSLARRDGDVFSLDSALRPAKLEVLLEAAAGRRTVVELGTGTAWATIALAIADPQRTIESWDPVARAQRERYLDLAGPDVRAADHVRRGPGRGRTRRGRAAWTSCSSTARTSASRRSPRSPTWRPVARARRARRVRRLRPPGLPGRREAVAELGRRGEARASLYLWPPATAATRRANAAPPPSTSSTPRAPRRTRRLRPAVASTSARADRAGVADVRQVGEHRDAERSRARRRRCRRAAAQRPARGGRQQQDREQRQREQRGAVEVPAACGPARAARGRRPRCAAPAGASRRPPRALPRAPPRRPRDAPLETPRETRDSGPLTAAIIVDPARGAAHARVPPESSPLTDGSFEHIAPRPGSQPCCARGPEWPVFFALHS